MDNWWLYLALIFLTLFDSYLKQLREENKALVESLEKKDRQIEHFKTTTLDGLKARISTLKQNMADYKKSYSEIKRELGRTRVLNKHLYKRMRKFQMELELRRGSARQ